MSNTLEIGGLTFAIRRSSRRKTLGLTVDRGGELIIHAPEHAEHAALDRWASQKLLWVHGKLAVKETMAPKTREPEYVSGECFFYLGRRYRLKITTLSQPPLHFDGKQFLLRPEACPADEHFRRWYMNTGGRWLRQRVELLVGRTGALPTRLEIRDLGYRWGSCAQSGVVRVNWKTLQFPVRLIDYVIVHELVHLREPHHRPGFYRALECALPDWRERAEQLKATARDAFWCA